MDIAALIAKASEAAPMPYTVVPEPNPRLVAHVDGDYMAYYAAGADGIGAGAARHNVTSRIDKLKFMTGATKVTMHLTHGASTKGQRFLVARQLPYQGQRNGGRKPDNWAYLREYMETYTGQLFTPRIWTTREADDGIAFATHTMASLKNELHVIHTRDKDMRMFAGIHVSWTDWKITEVPLGAYDIIGADGEQYGHKWFWMQMLHGDTADNIPGLAGVGPVKAASLLQGTSSNLEACPIVSGAYSDKYGDEWADKFAEQAILLWMRTDRHADLLDFLSLRCFGSAVVDAAHAIRERVNREQEELDALSCTTA